MTDSMMNRPRAHAREYPAADGMQRLRETVATIGRERILVAGLIIIGMIAHGFNMFRYPGFTLLGDEGVYVSQAWAVLREGSLSPYTYVYDHAPGGWLILAGWMALTGGPLTFGDAIDSGRLLMLVLHGAMIPLLYSVARKLGCGLPTATIATLLFSLSPLAIFYQRLVLLDTIMMFWILVSLDLLLHGEGKLSRVVLSGVGFGIALVTKETAIVLLPALLFIAVQQRWRHQGRFGVIGWIVPMLIIMSWYPLYALLKGELLPSGDLAAFSVTGYANTSVTLFDSIWWQMNRSGGGILNGQNDFWQILRTDWLVRDPLLVVGGAVATLVNLVRGIRDRRSLAAGLLGVFPLLYLARGGVVFNFYILLAIPFLCLNMAVLLAPIMQRLPSKVTIALTVATPVLLFGGFWQAGNIQPLYTEQPDVAGRQAVDWMKASLSSDSTIVIPDAFWTDLHEADVDSASFDNAHSHWKVASDPEIRDEVFPDGWQSVDFVVMVPDLEEDFVASNNTIALEALDNAHLVKRWESEGGDARLHTPSYVELWKVDRPGPTDQKLAADSADYLEKHFELNGAYPEANGDVTSEAQSYAMLRSVWSDDREAFESSWEWTQQHLQDDRGLLQWLWNDGEIVDPNTANDANVDTALALLMAGRQWDNPALVEEGRQMVQAIWEHEVVVVDGVPYLTAGDWATESDIVALNPSYLAPYAYRIFAEVDPEHDWRAAVDSSYDVLFESSSAELGFDRSAGLPPNWVGLDRNSGDIVPLEFTDEDTTQYGYDAARTYWRVAMDLRWSGDGRAQAYLDLAGFLSDEATRKGYVSSIYAHDGTIVQAYPSMVSTAGAIAALLVDSPDVAHSLYASQVVGSVKHHDLGVFWGDPSDLYGNEWGWFITSMYANQLPDLWHNPTGQ